MFLCGTIRLFCPAFVFAVVSHCFGVKILLLVRSQVFCAASRVPLQILLCFQSFRSKSICVSEFWFHVGDVNFLTKDGGRVCFTWIFLSLQIRVSVLSECTLRVIMGFSPDEALHVNTEVLLPLVLYVSAFMR